MIKQTGNITMIWVLIIAMNVIEDGVMRILALITLSVFILALFIELIVELIIGKKC